MAESIKYKKPDTYHDADNVYDFEQKKTQKEINASLVQADNLKSGYFVLPGGLKMCWGELKFTENEKQITLLNEFRTEHFTKLTLDNWRKIRNR